MLLEFVLLVGGFSTWFYWQGDLGFKLLVLLMFLLLVLQRNKPSMLYDKMQENLVETKRDISYCMAQLYILRQQLMKDDDFVLPPDWQEKVNQEFGQLQRSFNEGFNSGKMLEELSQPFGRKASSFLDRFFEFLVFGITALCGWGLVKFIEFAQAWWTS